MEKRSDLIDAITDESRRHYAAYVLFNQALAARLALHPSDLQCLSLLSLDAEPRTIGDVATLTGLTSGAATRLVDRLEHAGLVRRFPDQRDRRRMWVELTPSSEIDVAAAWDGPGRAFASVLDGYRRDELTVILDYLRRAGDVARAETERLSSVDDAGALDQGSRRA
ncbi:MAG TPA: MarR family transcriptional regulator [Solirubrobacter sp.]|nr:MarR family transcriptional regulator [Solirubrobacter sp.]